MKFILKNILVLSFSLIFGQLFSQSVVNPFVGSKTHPSMMIDSIVFTSGQTICHLTIENLSTEGNAWFCADSDISLIETSNDQKHELIRSEGIPVCPEAHKFTHTGERISFLLIFPRIRDINGEIDIIENCPEHCFLLKGVVLNQDLNKELRMFENGLALYQANEYNKALRVFNELKHSNFREENHYGYSLYIIPVLHLHLGEKKKAREAYFALKNNSFPNQLYFLEKIHEQAFFREIE